jgi:pimeloyl-ACP methyl ester carboxylesterase
MARMSSGAAANSVAPPVSDGGGASGSKGASTMGSITRTTRNVAGREVLVEGPADASARDTIVMLHGWPDTRALWDGVVAALAERHRCVRFTLPGFASGDEYRAYTLDEVTHLVHQVVLDAGGGAPVTILMHDWGCMYGGHFANAHPELVARIAAIDVGDAGSRATRDSLPFKGKAGIVFYQWVLALAWRIGAFAPGLGNRMARWMAAKMRVPRPPEDIRAAMGYPYWISWTGTHGSHRAVRALKLQWPVFFAWGERKPFWFHSNAWLEKIKALPGGRVMGFPSGHWVMLGKTAEAYHAALADWLQATRQPTT